jgi:hypothetical protein
VLNGAVRRIQSLHRFITRSANHFCDALIDCVVCVERKDLLSSRIENQFAERDAAHLLIFIQQPGDQSIRCRLSRSRSR